MTRRKTNSEFITEANKIHNFKYDYSLVQYKSNKDKVKIICPEHGVFEQIPNAHLMRTGCPICGKISSSSIRSKNKNEFIKASKKIHKDLYDYSLVEYKNNNTKVKIMCQIHGVFEQIPNSHLLGKGCAKCSSNYKSNTKKFIEQSEIVHNNKYDYSLVNYRGSHIKVKIICPDHGVFTQQPTSHLRKHGCPHCIKSCQTSKGEKEVLEYVKSFYTGSIIENDRKVLKGKELDIFLPELKIGIEYNGEYWHIMREDHCPGYHKLKKDLCQQNNISLYTINEKEWKYNKEKIKSILKKSLVNENISNK